MRICLLLLTCLMIACESTQDKATSALMIKDYSRAVLLFQQSLDEDPQNIESRQGLILSLVGRLDQQDTISPSDLKVILSELQTCHLASHDHCLPLVELKLRYENSKIQYKSGHYRQALMSIDSTLELSAMHPHLTQQDPQFLVAHLMNLKALILIELNRTHDAIELYYELIEKNPHYIQGYINLGSLLFDEAEYLESSLVLNQGLELDPQNEYLLFWLEQSLEEL